MNRDSTNMDNPVDDTGMTDEEMLREELGEASQQDDMSGD